MAKSKDAITLAKEFLSKADPTHTPIPSDKREKAKACGSLGGQKGGPARAAALTDPKKTRIGKKAPKSAGIPARFLAFDSIPSDNQLEIGSSYIGLITRWTAAQS